MSKKTKTNKKQRLKELEQEADIISLKLGSFRYALTINEWDEPNIMLLSDNEKGSCINVTHLDSSEVEQLQYFLKRAGALLKEAEDMTR